MYLVVSTAWQVSPCVNVHCTRIRAMFQACTTRCVRARAQVAILPILGTFSCSSFIISHIRSSCGSTVHVHASSALHFFGNAARVLHASLMEQLGVTELWPQRVTEMWPQSQTTVHVHVCEKAFFGCRCKKCFSSARSVHEAHYTMNSQALLARSERAKGLGDDQLL